MANIVRGVIDLFTGKRAETVVGAVEAGPEQSIVIDPVGVQKILPHRGRMLLLDRVVITTALVVGELEVRLEICEGHGVLPDGQLVLRGCDFLDMAAQLLGVWAAQFFPGQTAVVREYGGAKFLHPVVTGDLLRLEVEPANLRGETKIRGARKFTKVWGENFEARVSDKRVATIASVNMAVETLSD